MIYRILAGFALGAALAAALYVFLLRKKTGPEKADLPADHSQDQLKAVFEASPVSIVLSSLSTGIITDVNDAFTTLTGYRRGEAVGRRASDLNLWVDDSITAKISPVLRGAGAFDHLDSRIRTKAGEIKDTLASLTLIDVEGERRILRMDYDITERKGYEETLKASEEKFRSLVESLHNIVVVMDRDLRQVEVVGSESMLRKQKALEMRGKRPTETAGYEMGRIHEEKALEAFSGNFVTYEWSWQNPDGEINRFRTNLSPMRDGKGAITRVVSITHNITDLKLAQEAAVRSEGEMRKMLDSFISAMAAALDARDSLTAGHSHRVTEYAMGIGEAMGLDKITLKRIQVAGMMHDLGKIHTPDAILKKPAGLTPDEYAVIKKHAEYTRSIVKTMHLPEELHGLPEDAGLHHERPDGGGYPEGRSGEAIPLIARILAVADVFDAVTSRRHYRDAMMAEKALQIINEGKGSQFFPECVDAFNAYYSDSLREKFSGPDDGIAEA